MLIGERLKGLREEKGLSQGEIERRSGLLRCYVSRVENGHTVPAVETLEKLARALEVPMYRLFYDGDESLPPQRQQLEENLSWGNSGKSRRYFDRLTLALQKMTPNDRDLILVIAHRVNQRHRRHRLRHPVGGGRI
jgi:transcriptional regulator with XRE-family HTH domain